MNDYAWNSRDRGNVSYNIGRRGSNNVVSNRTIENKIIVSRNNPRIINNPDEVIDKAIIKLRGNNTNIRIYNNPNNVPPVIIRNNNNNINSIRNYNRPENNSNNNNIRNNNSNNTIIRNNSKPIINNSTSPVRSSPPTIRSNNISRGGNSGRKN